MHKIRCQRIAPHVPLSSRPSLCPPDRPIVLLTVPFVILSVSEGSEAPPRFIISACHTRFFASFRTPICFAPLDRVLPHRMSVPALFCGHRTANICFCNSLRHNVMQNNLVRGPLSRPSSPDSSLCSLRFAQKKRNTAGMFTFVVLKKQASQP